LRKPTQLTIVAAMLVAGISPPATAQEPAPLPPTRQQPTEPPAKQQPVERQAEKKKTAKTRPHPGERGYRFATSKGVRRDVKGFSENERIAWQHGRWRHERRFGRDGWWWEVNGAWYWYGQPMQGPPPYVSEFEVVDDSFVPAAPRAEAPGYPPYGYPPPGYPAPGYPPPGYPPPRYPAYAYPGYPPPGYPAFAYPAPRYPASGYPQPGYPAPYPAYPPSAYPPPDAPPFDAPPPANPKAP